jgi:hypothetical protein
MVKTSSTFRRKLLAPGGRGQPPGRSYIAQRSSGEAVKSAAHVDDLFE